MVFIKEKVRIKRGFSEFLREKYSGMAFYSGKSRKKKMGKHRAKKAAAKAPAQGKSNRFSFFKKPYLRYHGDS